VLEWTWLKPRVFKRKGEPYGLVAIKRIKNTNWIFSCSVNDGKFTKDMIAAMIMATENSQWALTFLKKSDNVDKITKAVLRYGAEISEFENHYIAFSVNNKKKRIL
jgi:hypothetical protein